jgi:hypothetical protein
MEHIKLKKGKEARCLCISSQLFLAVFGTLHDLSIYLSGLVTAVAVFRNPNTIPFCLATDLLLNV